MDTTSQQVASTLGALSQQYLGITSNIANASTPAYKRRMTAFSQALSKQMDPTGAQESFGVKPATSGEVKANQALDFTQGGMNRTGNPLDFVISGKGFMVVQTPDGELYTRNGAFRLNAQGQLTDAQGRMIAGEGGPIVMPSTASVADLHAGSDGTLSANGATIGKLRVVDVPQDQLMPVGNGTYQLPVSSAAKPSADFTVQQGYREMSNVNVVQEMVSLITVSRLYEANMKSMKTQDERLKNLLGVAGS